MSCTRCYRSMRAWCRPHVGNIVQTSMRSHCWLHMTGREVTAPVPKREVMLVQVLDLVQVVKLVRELGLSLL